QFAAGPVQAEDAGDGLGALVLVQLRVQVGLAVARAVGGEQDPVVAGVDRRDVVVAGGLAGDLGDPRGLATAQSGHLVQLPLGVVGPVLALRGTDHHAEDGLVAAPVHRRLAHRDGVRALLAVHAVAG